MNTMFLYRLGYDYFVQYKAFIRYAEGIEILAEVLAGPQFHTQYHASLPRELCLFHTNREIFSQYIILGDESPHDAVRKSKLMTRARWPEL